MVANSRKSLAGFQHADHMTGAAFFLMLFAGILFYSDLFYEYFTLHNIAPGIIQNTSSYPLLFLFVASLLAIMSLTMMSFAIANSDNTSILICFIAVLISTLIIVGGTIFFVIAFNSHILYIT